jgi:hypothetical protein
MSRRKPAPDLIRGVKRFAAGNATSMCSVFEPRSGHPDGAGERRMTERLITDIGGLAAGEVPREEVPQLYWEKHMIAMFNVLWSKGVFNLDEFRRTVEGTSPDAYHHSTFYGRRLDGMTDLLVEKGIIDREELARRTERILREGSRDHA